MVINFFYHFYDLKRNDMKTLYPLHTCYTVAVEHGYDCLGQRIVAVHCPDTGAALFFTLNAGHQIVHLQTLCDDFQPVNYEFNLTGLPSLQVVESTVSHLYRFGHISTIPEHRTLYQELKDRIRILECMIMEQEPVHYNNRTAAGRIREYCRKNISIVRLITFFDQTRINKLLKAH